MVQFWRAAPAQAMSSSSMPFRQGTDGLRRRLRVKVFEFAVIFPKVVRIHRKKMQIVPFIGLLHTCGLW